MHTIHNARVTLTATIVNNVAVAFIVAGFVAPAASGQLVSAGRFLVALVWLGIGIGLHLLGRSTLGGLKQ